MKKLSETHKKWLTRHCKLQAERRVISRSARTAKRLARKLNLEKPRWISVYRNGRMERALLTGDARPVPSELSLVSNYEETVGFLREIRERLAAIWRQRASIKIDRSGRRRQSPPVIRSYWDFSHIKRMSPAVALVIAAEYDRLRRRGGWAPRAIDLENWDPNVRAMLRGIGFLELAGVEPASSEFLSTQRWKILRFRAGHDADGPEIGALLEQLKLRDAVNDAPIYEAIVEALVNTKHHAYPSEKKFQEPHVPGWWLTGHMDIERRRLTVIAYDQGVTIPGTLDTWDKYPKFRKAWDRLFRLDRNPDDSSRDGATIALAMAVGRTSTKLGFRGKGLPAIEQAVDLCKDGKLTHFQSMWSV